MSWSPHCSVDHLRWIPEEFTHSPRAKNHATVVEDIATNSSGVMLLPSGARLPLKKRKKKPAFLASIAPAPIIKEEKNKNKIKN